MKVNIIQFVVVIALGFLVAGCGGNQELKKEAGIFADAMCRNIAQDLAVPSTAVNVKGKTNEKLGYLGRGDAIEAQAICLLTKI